MLSHITNSTAGRENYEVVTNDLFKVTFVFPSLITSDPILTEHVKSVTGWKDAGVETVEFSFMQAKSNYASNAFDNRQTITITFTQNLDKKLRNYVYKKMKEWKDLVMNTRTGLGQLKDNYVGQIIVEKFTRDRQLVYSRILKSAFPTGEWTGHLDFDYNSPDPIDLPVTFSGDYDDEDER